MEFENKKLAFSTNAQTYLKSIAGWGMFIALLGFISAAFSLIGLFVSFKVSVLTGIVSLASLVVQILATIGLFTFASKVKKGIENRDTQVIDAAFKGMVTYFLFTLVSFAVSFLSIFLR